MKISLLFRNPNSGNFSIENVFNTLKPYLGKCCNYQISSYSSSGFLNRLRIILEAQNFKSMLVHVSGDITFTNLLLSKSVITFHDFEFIHRAKGLKRAILKLFWVTLPAKRATKITVISKATEDALNKLVHVSQEKVQLIYNPITIKKESRPIQELKFGVDEYVLCIGTKKNKNLEAVIKITQENKIKLLVLGELNSEQELLIEDKALFQNLINVGEKELVYLYQQAAMLCFCSFEEGFGLPIVEAQYLGCPVITSNCSSMPEIAGDGAMFVDPYSSLDIKTAINMLFSNENSRLDLIERGLENCKRFQPQLIAQQYLDLYKEILGC